MFYKKAVLKNFAIFTGKHLCWGLFIKKLQTFRPATLLKRDFCEYSEIFKNNYFEENLRTAVSEIPNLNIYSWYEVDICT